MSMKVEVPQELDVALASSAYILAVSIVTVHMSLPVQPKTPCSEGLLYKVFKEKLLAIASCGIRRRLR